MADTKITALAELTTGADNSTDVLPLVDISDTSMAASGTNKKIKPLNLLRTMRATVLPAPAGLTASNSSPGKLATNTYYYVYTAVDVEGNEFAKSSEASVAVTGPTGWVIMSLNPSVPSTNMVAPVPGAYEYRLYRGTSTGAQDRYITIRDNASARDYGDAGLEVVAAPPSSGTLYDNAVKAEGAGWLSAKQVVVSNEFTTGGVNISSGIDSYVSSKQSGRVSDGHAAIKGVVKDRNDVTSKTITGAVTASGLIRITATAHGYANGDRVTIYGVVGTTEANGLWTISNVAANTFDLVGSTFVNTYTSGGTASNMGLMYAGLFMVEPKLDRDVFTTNVNGEDAVGIVIVNNGSARATEGLYIGTNGNMANAFGHGVAVDAPATNGFALGGGKTFTTGLNMTTATLTNGIDMSLATISGMAIKTPFGAFDSSKKIGIGTNAPAVLNGGMGIHVKDTSGTLNPEIYIESSAGASLASIFTIAGRSSSAAVRAALYAGGGSGAASYGTETNHDFYFFTNGSGNARWTFTATGGITVAEGVNMALGTSTGTKIGTATNQKLGFFNSTPIIKGTAFTQTYSTASHTHANVTASNPPVGGTGTAAGGYDTAANRNLMITSLTNTIADVANVKQVLNGLIDDLQALGLIA